MPSNAPGHIAIILLTSQSHIYPSLALIRELVSRGHRVTIGVGEGQRELLEPLGAEVVGHPSSLPDPSGRTANTITEIPKDAGEFMLVFLREGMAQLPHLTTRFDDDRPDVVLYDPGAMAGQVLARRYGVPGVMVTIMAAIWPSTGTQPEPAPPAPAPTDSARLYYELANGWLAANGITEDAGHLQSNPDGILSMVPRIMQADAGRAPETVRFVGPCIDPQRLAEDGWSPPRSGKPVVLVSFGNSFNDRPEFYRTCLKAFAGSGWHVVLVAGTYAHAADFQDVPEDLEIRERVPQLRVLEHAAAFVTHAGMGGCVEGLWYGVPMVAVPQGVDQFSNAARLVEIGVGRHLSADTVTEYSLWQAVHDVMHDGDVAGRLARIRDELRSAGGVTCAADTVESYLTRVDEPPPAHSIAEWPGRREPERQL